MSTSFLLSTHSSHLLKTPLLSPKWTQLLLQAVNHGGLGPGGDGSLSQATELTGHRKMIIAESAKVGPLLNNQRLWCVL